MSNREPDKRKDRKTLEGVEHISKIIERVMKKIKPKDIPTCHKCKKSLKNGAVLIFYTWLYCYKCSKDCLKKNRGKNVGR